MGALMTMGLALVALLLLGADSAPDGLPPVFEAERQLRMGEAGAALAVLDALLADPAIDLATRAQADVLRAGALDRLGRWAEAQALFVATSERYRDASDPKARYYAAGALVDLGSAQLRREDKAGADAAWVLAEQRFGKDEDREVRETAHSATLARVMARAEAGDVAGAKALAADVTSGIGPDALPDRIALRDALLSLLVMMQMAGPLLERPPEN